MAELKNIIRSARVKQGLTQQDMAVRLGIVYQTYNKWECHPEKLTVEKIEAISLAIGIDPSDIFMQINVN